MSTPLRRIMPSARLVWPLLVLVAVGIGMATSSNAATSSVVVSMSVPSATTLDAAGCPQGTPARSFGTVLPGASAVTGAPCSVLFGSSNDTSSLRLLQTDGVGAAMFGATRAGAVVRAGFSVTAGSDEAFGVAVQRDGKIVIVGTASGNAFVARRLAAGGIDPTFNGGVDRIFDFGSASDIWMDVELGWDGSIYLGGHDAPGAARNGYVTKLTPTGADDPAFGGIKIIDFSGAEDSVEGVEVDSRGRLIAVGGSNVAGITQFTVSRYKDNGALDETFNTTGRRAIPFGGYSFALDVAILANDGLAISGTTSGTGLDFALVVLNSAGVDEPTFNGTAIGRQALSLAANDDAAQGVAVQEDGKLILVGSSVAGTAERVGVVRINATGGVDTSFAGGAQRLNYVAGNEYAEGVIVQPDGAVVISGRGNNMTNASVLRLTTAGAFDTTFNGTGRIAVAGTDAVGRPVLGPNGGLVFAGRTTGDVELFTMAGTSYPDFAGAWSASRFGACLETLSAGTNVWPVAGANNCVISTPASWRGVAAQSGDASAIVAQTASGTATAAFRFGLQVDPAQSPGTYAAQLSFEVVAPM